MTFTEMAGFMVSIGASEAFNFDGGGSTQWLCAESWSIRPPIQPESAVWPTHSMWSAMLLPERSISFPWSPYGQSCFRGAQQFTAIGADEYYNPIALPADAIWEADPSIGTINSSGLHLSKDQRQRVGECAGTA